MAFLKASVFPRTAKVDAAGHLVLGDCDVADLVSRFDTPLYVFDEEDLRSRCREFVQAFSSLHPKTTVIYACKAFVCQALVHILQEEGVGLDVVSGGELAVARSVGFPAARVYFHGNNKGRQELREALDWGIGRVVVDNFHEIYLLNGLAAERGRRQDVLLRVSPSVDPHTHAHTTTGILDSKFGFPIQNGHAEEALLQAKASPYLNVLGLHFHLGSPIFETAPYVEAIQVTMEFAARLRSIGLELSEFSPGGGFAVPYLEGQAAPSPKEYAEAIVGALVKECAKHSIPVPRLVIEPGRALVGPAGVALYAVGARKDIPGVRKYVSVDGGMGDNIRPALYGALYEVVAACKMGRVAEERVTIAGKFCESGDILARDVLLPALEAGDILAVPVSGAYAPSMASNYNMAPRPAIVLVRSGRATLIRRRESYADLMRCDLLEG